MNIIPKVNGTIKMEDGSIHLSQKITVCFDGIETYAADAFLERTGCIAGNDSDFVLIFRKNAALSDEGYILKVTREGVLVEAGSETGTIWGLTTLWKLSRESESIPICEITDQPVYAHRGLSLDTARHFFDAEEVKKIIEQLSQAKMNVLHWHLADDQGFRVESLRFPLLHKTSVQYYTREEISDVVSFAKKRGVEIIPEIDMPGHTTGILAAYPEYGCSKKKVPIGKEAGIYRDILCAGQEAVFDFLEQLLEEICPLFPSGQFHIGGDEAPKNAWKECPCCKARMAELRYSNFEDLQGYFSDRVSRILKRHGKTVICWNDLLKASVRPENMKMQYWSLQYGAVSEEFAKAGGQWIYSDMFEIYLDYPYSMTPVKKVFDVKPHFGKLPCEKGTEPVGLEACIWAEHIETPERLEELLFPRIYALAEAAWGKAGDYHEFLTRLEAETGRMKEEGVHVTGKDWWDPKGSARRKEAFSYLQAINSGMSEEKMAETVESTAPNKEFGKAFMSQFFKPSDLPFLLKFMK